MKKSKRSVAQINEAARKPIQADNEKRRAARPERERPTIDPATYEKTCSVCRETKKAEGNFFRVKATRDGYAYRCKTCWNVHGEALPERPAEPTPIVVQAARRYPYQPGTTTHAFTKEEERKLVKQAPAGQRELGYVRVGGMLVPVIGWNEQEFIDVEARI